MTTYRSLHPSTAASPLARNSWKLQSCQVTGADHAQEVEQVARIEGDGAGVPLCPRTQLDNQKSVWPRSTALTMDRNSRPAPCQRNRHHRSRKQTRLVQSHFPVPITRFERARTWPPMSAGEIVFSSTKVTPPWFRPASAQVLSSGGI